MLNKLPIEAHSRVGSGSGSTQVQRPRPLGHVSGASAKSLAAWICAGLMIAGSAGCAMCCNPYDSHYAGYGGAWERLDPAFGRVGSQFEPAGDMVVGPAPTEQGAYPLEEVEPGRSILQPPSEPESGLPEDVPPDWESLFDA